MKIKILCLLIFFYVGSLKSQNLPLDPLLDTDPIEKSKVSVLLYQIDLDEGKFPIRLDYNSSGVKVTEVPGVVGVSWGLSNIGKITRKLNHLPDEYIAKETDFYDSPSNPAEKPNANGWFFSKDIDPYSHIGSFFNPDNPFGNGVNLLSTGTYQSKFIDSAPDFFTLETSNGINSTFFFEKKFVSGNLTTPLPVVLETNLNINILTNFQKFNHGLTNYSDVVFELSNDKGLNYKFIGGPNKYSIQRDAYGFSHQYKDFYLKTIEFKKNNDIVTINYTENLLVQYNWLKTARYSASGYLLDEGDYAYSPLSKLEMSEIITPKEKIMFSYITKNINTGAAYISQDVKQLKEMSVFNNLGEYVTGYDFEYQYFVDGRFILKKIFRFNSDKSERILIREFEYYPESPNPMNSNNKDVFDYSNEANNSHNGIPYTVKHGTPLVALAPADRSAEQEKITYTGMLRNVKNNLGGVTQYSYQLKSDGINYGGGLVISRIEEDFGDGNKKVTNFNYSDLRGFVLPLTNYQPYFMEHVQNSSFVTDQPAFLLDTDPIDYNPMFNYSQTQLFGNYFKNVSISTRVKNHVDGIGGDAIITSYEFIPSYTGLYRKPLLFKKKVLKSLYHSSDDIEGITISEEERRYDIVSTKIVHTSKIKNKSWGQRSQVEITRSPIYSIIQPLRLINNKNYLNDTEFTFNEIKTEYSYLGDSNQEYVLNDLMPKNITISVNSNLVSKTVYTYLCEMIESNQALEYLTEFRDQNNTRVSSVSKWNFNQEFILKECKFLTYHIDGKIKETFKVYKNRLNNSFYNSTTNPFYYNYNNVDLGGIPLDDRIRYSYNSNGKLSSIENFESNTFQSFSRANDKDDYSVNSVITGDMNSDHTSFYRNSFEGNQATSNIIVSPLAMTGNKVFVGSELQMPYFPAGYEISFWYFANGKWQLKNLNHNQNGTVVITMPSGATMIDEVWIKPKNSTLTGTTNEPLKGENDIVDENGNVVRNIYDQFGRLIKVTDKNNNIIEKTEYNYIAE